MLGYLPFFLCFDILPAYLLVGIEEISFHSVQSFEIHRIRTGYWKPTQRATDETPFWCTLTFGQKSPKLNSGQVYCLRLYGVYKLKWDEISQSCFLRSQPLLTTSSKMHFLGFTQWVEILYEWVSIFICTCNFMNFFWNNHRGVSSVSFLFWFPFNYIVN